MFLIVMSESSGTWPSTPADPGRAGVLWVLGVAQASTHLAREIKRLRKDADLSQPELAGLIGYTRQYVSMAERVGKNIPSQGLIKAPFRRADHWCRVGSDRGFTQARSTC